MLTLLILFLAVGSPLASAGIFDSIQSPARGRSISRGFQPNHGGWGSRESLLIPNGRVDTRRSRPRQRLDPRHNRWSPSSSSSSDSGYSSPARSYVNQAYQHDDNPASRNRNAGSSPRQPASSSAGPSSNRPGPPRANPVNINLASGYRDHNHAPLRRPAGIDGPSRGPSWDQPRPSTSSVTWSTRSPDDRPPRS
ncbi:hypothetical protein CDD80_1105 [Ophiocordyceps camponoti-rufipedis]|uniref:Uncharacterized protein n=1 Tax=Ophiocordyceps camponoti-rufipedis TaxID=2004952 RepID=A0A2C5ZCM8_9HYPO|nr:hypothetical protein CDD80_1105 [Ophiocordyceps camponoti-rufipedis]